MGWNYSKVKIDRESQLKPSYLFLCETSVVPTDMADNCWPVSTSRDYCWGSPAWQTGGLGLCKLTHAWERAEICTAFWIVEIKEGFTRNDVMGWSPHITSASGASASLGEHHHCTVEAKGSSQCFQQPLSVTMAPWQGRKAPLPGRMAALGLSPYWEVKQFYISHCNAFLYISVTACAVQRPKLLPRCGFKLTQSKNK